MSQANTWVDKDWRKLLVSSYLIVIDPKLFFRLASLQMTSMLMTSLFPVPTPTLIRWLTPFLPIHQILRSWQMSEV